MHFFVTVFHTASVFSSSYLLLVLNIIQYCRVRDSRPSPRLGSSTVPPPDVVSAGEGGGVCRGARA